MWDRGGGGGTLPSLLKEDVPKPRRPSRSLTPLRRLPPDRPPREGPGSPPWETEGACPLGGGRSFAVSPGEISSALLGSPPGPTLQTDTEQMNRRRAWRCLSALFPPLWMSLCFVRGEGGGGGGRGEGERNIRPSSVGLSDTPGPGPEPVTWHPGHVALSRRGGERCDLPVRGGGAMLEPTGPGGSPVGVASRRRHAPATGRWRS